MKIANITRSALRLAGVGGVLALCIAASSSALAQKAFPTAEEAMTAFGDAVARSDSDAMKSVLGADYHQYIPPAGDRERLAFLSAWAKSHAIQPQGADRALVTVGGQGWTLPIPIVRQAAGWTFDLKAGSEEMRIRRIGRNELAAMQALLAVVDAQLEYASVDRNGNGLREYATRFTSTPGKRDGLYWPTKAGEPDSPLGPAYAYARAAGGSASAGYFGYRFRLLDAQGPNAPGGALDFKVRGSKIGGFAVIATPVRYGDTGVMTFMVNHAGIVYEKDLGPDTAARAAAIRRFDPDSSWTRADPDK
jgi:hypothetical protein